VLYFAGDSLISIFENKLEEVVEKRDLDSTSIAVHCANRIHLFCSKTSHLSAHVAIEYGEINFSVIGGYLNQWVYVATGKCIDSIGNCLEEAESNQTVLSEAAYFQLTDPQIEVEKLQSGRYAIISSSIDSRSKSFFRTFSFHHPLPSLGSSVSTSPFPSPQRNSSITDEIQNSISLFKNIKYKVPHPTFSAQPSFPLTESQSIALASHIVCFIPRPVLEGISLNLLNQLSEMRTVTTLFLKVDHSVFKDQHELGSLHQFFFSMQECLADSGGYLRQFLFDDKGCVLIALWGVPTATFANNCSRALRCAVMMSRQAKQFGCLLSIGISTGSVYCGTVGLSGVRQDYVAIGKSVNLAARLMCRANGRILLDDQTFGCLPLEIATLYISALPQFDIKGFTEPCNIFWYSSNNLPPFVIRDTPADSSLVVEKYISKQFATCYSYLSSLREVVCSRESVSDPLLNSHCGGDQNTNSGEAHAAPKSLLSDITQVRNNFFFGKRPYFFMIYGSPGWSFFFSHSPSTSLFFVGMGKTAMATYLSRKYKCMGFNVTFVRASPIDEAIDFNILKKIIVGLISLINENAFTNDLQTQREVITSLLKKAFPTEDMKSLTQNRFPYLRKVLQLTWELVPSPEVGQSYSLPPSHQQEQHGSQLERNCQTITMIIRAIIGMLQGNGSSGNVVIIDNAHFMCSSTWKEITKLITLHCPLLVVLTFRIHEVGNLSELKKRNESLCSTNEPKESNCKGTSSLAQCASSFFLSTLQRRYEEQHGNSVEIVRHSAEYATLLTKLSSLNSSSLHLKPLNFQSFVKIFYKTFSPSDSNASSRFGLNDHHAVTVKSVYRLSQGIPFWIWKIIKFLKFSGDPIANFDYRSFICCLLDKFTETEKNIIKCASVVGAEFHVDVLKRMIAPFLLPELEDILFSLVDSGLINLINGKLFFFRSPKIREYIYSLIPPSDAISLHLLAADTIEIIQSHEMTLYTPA
jgi:class 3 adenylate cyclase